MTESKRVLRMNVRALLEKQGGELRPNESGVTRLVNLGIPNGNAQRLLDDKSDVRLSTLDELAGKLNIHPAALLSPSTASASMSFRDLDPYEAQLVTFFRQLGDDERHRVLVDLNHRAAGAHAPDAWAGRERRFSDVGHAPDRRSKVNTR